jgi:hypothetical protein
MFEPGQALENHRNAQGGQKRRTFRMNDRMPSTQGFAAVILPREVDDDLGRNGLTAPTGGTHPYRDIRSIVGRTGRYAEPNYVKFRECGHRHPGAIHGRYLCDHLIIAATVDASLAVEERLGNCAR